jgi:hypothetical protein
MTTNPSRTRVAPGALAVALLTIGTWADALVGPASAETYSSFLVRNNKIRIDYVEPRHPVYAGGLRADDPEQAEAYKKQLALYERYSNIYERLRRRRLLEEFSQFLAPVRLPITLRLKTQQCGVANAFYSPLESVITLCYEYVAEIEDRAPKETTPQGITRAEAIVGQVVGTLLHEAGHAISNLLQLPVLGREEDTADQLAAFIMLQFGPSVARTLIKGKAYGWYQADRRNVPSYWGVHSTALQRQHTFLCIAFGHDPESFKDFVQFGWLPRLRAENCADEYRQVELAFRMTVLPHLDPELVRQVRTRRWLLPEDLQ